MKQEELEITYNDGFYVSLSLFSIIIYYIIRKIILFLYIHFVWFYNVNYFMLFTVAIFIILC